MTHSENIRRFRREKGLTQEQLGDALGVSSQAVSKWETGDTYPDGSLLVPLADALGVTLDELFGRSGTTLEGLGTNIASFIHGCGGDGLEYAHELCWQIERGLFGLDSFGSVKNIGNSSEIESESGFTVVSNGDSPFFALFRDMGGFAETVGDGEEARCLFEKLSDKDVMRAILFLYTKKRNYLFSKEVLASVCVGDIDRVVDTLSELNVVAPRMLEIDGVETQLYYNRPSSKIMALFLMAHETYYRGAYSLQSSCRNESYFK